MAAAGGSQVEKKGAEGRRTPGLEEPGKAYRRLVEGLRSEYFFYQHGPDGVFTYVSPSIRSVLGYTQENFLKHYTSYLTDNPVNNEVVRHTRQSLRGRRQPPYRVEIFHKDGRPRWLEVLEVPVWDKERRRYMVEGIAHDVTGKMEAMNELREYRARVEELAEERTAELKAIFENTPVSLTLLDEGLNILRTNSGPPGSRFIGEALKCFNAECGRCGRGKRCPDCDLRRMAAATLRTGRGISRVQTELTNREGRRMVYLVSTAVIRRGGKKRLLMCLDDITGQKEAEDSLRRSEDFRRIVLSSVGDGIVVVDAGGRVQYMNEAAQGMLGWTLQELRGKPLHRAIHSRHGDGSPYPEAECPLYEAYALNKASVVQDEILWRADGAGMYARYSARPMVIDGRVFGAVMTFSDISERRRIERELLLNKERLQLQNSALVELGRKRKKLTADSGPAFREAAETAASALAADRVSIWTFSEDRSALDCSTAFDRITGRHAVIGRIRRSDCPAFFRHLDSGRLLTSDDEAQGGAIPEFARCLPAACRPGAVMLMPVTAGKKPYGVICAEKKAAPPAWRLDDRNMLGAVADFAAIALLGEEKAKLSAMKDFLTHTIVHDLKSPLVSIILAGQMLSDDGGKTLTESQKEMLSILNSQAETMKRMISDILDINRLEEGKLCLKRERLVPGELLRGAAASMRMLAESDGKRMVLKEAQRAEEVYGERDLLRRVLENLLANALKFSPSGSEIEAGLRPSGARGFSEFYVRDRGPGIPAEFREKVFEKFVQLDGPASAKWGGKGLGLAFCKLAVEAHGGRIWVEEAAGGGTLLAFSVPSRPPSGGK